MSQIITYLLKFSLSLSVVYLFYQLVLRRLTFYNWNRWYLIFYSMICFLVPFINISEALQQGGLQNSRLIGYIPVVEQFSNLRDKQPVSEMQHFNWQLLYLAILFAGTLLMAGRLMMQYFSLKKLSKGAVLLYDENVKLFHVEGNILPFSFGNSIYINKDLHEATELHDIIR